MTYVEEIDTTWEGFWSDVAQNLSSLSGWTKIYDVREDPNLTHDTFWDPDTGEANGNLAFEVAAAGGNVGILFQFTGGEDGVPHSFTLRQAAIEEFENYTESTSAVFYHTDHNYTFDSTFTGGTYSNWYLDGPDDSIRYWMYYGDRGFWTYIERFERDNNDETAWLCLDRINWLFDVHAEQHITQNDNGQEYDALRSMPFAWQHMDHSYLHTSYSALGTTITDRQSGPVESVPVIDGFVGLYDVEGRSEQSTYVSPSTLYVGESSPHIETVLPVGAIDSRLYMDTQLLADQDVVESGDKTYKRHYTLSTTHSRRTVYRTDDS